MNITKEQHRNFPRRLKQWRESRDWVHKQAAAYLGVSIGGYRKWENGQRRPHRFWMADILEKMAASDRKSKEAA